MGKFGEFRQTATSLAGRCFGERRWFYFGPAFCVVLLTFTHYTFGYKQAFNNLSYADVACLTGIICALFLFILIKAVWFERIANRLLFFSCSFVLLGFFCMSNLDRFPAETTVFLMTASAIALGIYDVVVPVFWFKFYAEQDIEITSFSMLISLIVGCALSWFLLGMGSDRLFWGMVLVIICSGRSLILALRSLPAAKVTPIKKEFFSFSPVFPLLLVAFLFSFTLMLSVSFVGLETWHTEVGWSVLWPAAFVLAITAFFAKRINIGALLYVALTLVVAGLLIASFLHINASFVLTIATMGFAVHISYMIILFCSLSMRSTFQAEHLACLFILAIFTGCLLGRPAAMVIGSFDGIEPLQASVSICLIIVIIACTLACSNNQTIQLYTNYRFQQIHENIPKSILSTPLIDEYVINQGLGVREREALALLLDGHTASQVADEMFIARGTAKAHIRHIYKKLDVHDREELFRLIKTVDGQYQCKSVK